MSIGSDALAQRRAASSLKFVTSRMPALHLVGFRLELLAKRLGEAVAEVHVEHRRRTVVGRIDRRDEARVDVPIGRESNAAGKARPDLARRLVEPAAREFAPAVDRADADAVEHAEGDRQLVAGERRGERILAPGASLGAERPAEPVPPEREPVILFEDHRTCGVRASRTVLGEGATGGDGGIGLRQEGRPRRPHQERVSSRSAVRARPTPEGSAAAGPAPRTPTRAG